MRLFLPLTEHPHVGSVGFFYNPGLYSERSKELCTITKNLRNDMINNTFHRDHLLTRYDHETSSFRRDPKDPRNFAISSVLVRNYDRTSKIYHNPNDFDLFDNRSDMAMLKNQLGVAAVISVANLNAIEPTARSTTAMFRVALVDETADQEVTGSPQRVHMSASTMSKDIRVDLPLPYLMAQPTHDYRVKILSTRTNRTICSRKIRFFDLPVLKTIPTKWFSTKGAQISVIPKEVIFARPHTHNVSISFRLECQIQEIACRVPELAIRLYLPGDIIREQYLIPEPADGESELFTATFSDDVEGMPASGFLYAELRIMGFPISGLILPIEHMTPSNEVKENELVTVHGPVVQSEIERTYNLLTRYRNIDVTTDSEYAIERLESEIIEQISYDPSFEEKSRMEKEIYEKYLDEDADDEEGSSCLEQTPSFPSEASCRLANLVGLEQVKEMIERQTELQRFLALRRDADFATPSMPLHSLFLGSPGTGKTTVGKLLGELLKEAGALSKGHVVFRERATLLGQYYSSECEKTLEALEEAQGGILFIDEAYQLFQPEDPRDPGKFVLETLMTALADPDRRDWMLVLSGYSKPMLEMIKSNPGLASRIPASNHYHFPDFDAQQLMEVATRYCMSNDFELSRGAEAKLAMKIENDWRHRDERFGNARYVVNLLETEIIPSMAQRVMAITRSPISLPEGFPTGFAIPQTNYVSPSLLRRIEPIDIPL